jgi:hypothetical protein
MREMQEDPSYYCQALGVHSIASPETVRQRMDILGVALMSQPILEEESARLLTDMEVQPGKTFTGHVAMDVDVSIHDNSDSKKEGVKRTYMGVDGYAPIYAYLGEEGYLLSVELREGNVHCQKGTVGFLEKSVELAKQITGENLLVRMDSGNDSLDNIKLLRSKGVDFLIKRNLRDETWIDWLKFAHEQVKPDNPRPGKAVYTGETWRDRGIDGGPVRIVYQVTVRTSQADGQMLLVPKVDVATWWTSVENPPEDILQLYREHAASEQFHAEIKSDIGLERFPSGKFATNAAILKLGGLAYNLLRVIGQASLKTGTPVSRKTVSRLRAKTVIKRLIYIACRVVSHARTTSLLLGQSNLWKEVFAKVHTVFV